MAGIWYRAGSVSVTNGSKKVTGFGTQWATSVIKPKKGHTVHAPDGRQYELDYVESDTVMYLVTAYAGVTATGQAYAIDITRSDTIPAFSRDLAAFTAYAQGQYDSWQQVLTGTGTVTLTAPDGQQIQVPALSAMQPASASLKAIQALVPAKDKIPVFNGAAGAELIALTAFIRTLLDDDSASAALGTLGALASSSYKPRADSLNNSGGAISVFTGDCNAMKAGDFRLIDTLQAQNAPPAGTQYCYVETKSIYSTGTLLQVAWPYGGNGALLFRNYSQNTSTWSPWRKVFDSRNILGSVSQSGGIPTGAIIERGSNANGTYTKFADGLMICVSNLLASNTEQLSSSYGGFYGLASTPQWTYPAPFIAPPKVSPSQTYISASFGIIASTISSGTTIAKIQQYALSSRLSGYDLYAVAIGYWY
ncbi:pyocin knob domain-containing protein [Aeromonas sp. D3]|uniref:pyocin knob domain-containing protein n=1 Tax=Aeromonas sp. D3 TaxID=2990474 RepID=UPI0022E50DE7|nr:pyocin knob domain-containing protein [Aeromonas sp. D3]